MQFGLFIPQGWRMDLVGIGSENHWQVMRDLATYADDGPWDSLWVYDHFHTVPMPSDEATHEAWTLMAAYAATTSRIKIGQMCTAMSYRNPAYLAKVAATTDIISGGRLQMGIGGGWYEHEWRAYGYGFPSAGVRLARLDEGVILWTDRFLVRVETVRIGRPQRKEVDDVHPVVSPSLREPDALANRRVVLLGVGRDFRVARHAHLVGLAVLVGHGDVPAAAAAGRPVAGGRGGVAVVVVAAGGVDRGQVGDLGADGGEVVAVDVADEGVDLAVTVSSHWRAPMV
jgi:alkanesulfonate monooxygenase SsuD/methylene tetrahydromethanopterin reductase-like flavin-dependent oxidoreductase (luciferase family)